MRLGAFLAVLLLLVLLGAWVVMANVGEEWTTFALGGDLRWGVPNWGLALGGFAAGALFVLLLSLGKGSQARPESDRRVAEALSALGARLEEMTAQLRGLAERIEAAQATPQENKDQPSAEDA